MSTWVLQSKKDPEFHWNHVVGNFANGDVKYATQFTDEQKARTPKPKGSRWVKLKSPDRFTVEPGRIIALEGTYLFRIEPEEGMRPTHADRLAHYLCLKLNEGAIEC